MQIFSISPLASLSFRFGILILVIALGRNPAGAQTSVTIYDGTYTSTRVLPDGFTHTETDIVSGGSIVGTHTYTNGTDVGSFIWNGTISSYTSTDATITGAGTITDIFGTRPFTITSGNIVADACDGTADLFWLAVDPRNSSSIGWETNRFGSPANIEMFVAGEVAPSNALAGQSTPSSTPIHIVVSQSSQRLPGITLTLRNNHISFVEAGHLHLNVQSAPTGSFVQQGSPVASCVTNNQGTCDVSFLAPQVSGRYEVVATCSGSQNSEMRVIDVRLPGLQPLSPSSLYRLTGAVTGMHVDNHYGSVRLIEALRGASFQYFKITGGKLGINDMSLAFGGIFDKNGTWSPPHGLHRAGLSVDIDNRDNPSRLNADKILDALMRKYRFKRIPERIPSIHYESEVQ